jgi:ribonuclease HI
VSAAASLPSVTLFTDGACSGNPGPGGWAYILRHPASGKEKEASGGLPETTNNQMELSAVIEGLKALKSRSRVEVVTDSSYVAKGAKEWLPGWKRNGWRRKEKNQLKPVKNVEFWQQLDELLGQHDVRFTLVKGHAGHPENERCDELAVAASMQFVGTPRPRCEAEESTSGDDASAVNSKPDAKSPQPGDPCRKCGAALETRVPKKHKLDSAYYFEWYLFCPECATMYMVEEAKRVRKTEKPRDV